MNRNCAMKTCAIKNEYSTCAECSDFPELKECKKLNNLIASFFDLIFGTDRIGNLKQIREIGMGNFKQKKQGALKP